MCGKWGVHDRVAVHGSWMCVAEEACMEEGVHCRGMCAEETVTEAGGMYPTGMLSCLVRKINLDLLNMYQCMLLLIVRPENSK